MYPPPLAPFPLAALQGKIMPDEWDLCVESWLLLTQQYLLLPHANFEAQMADKSSLVEFMTSYVASNSVPGVGTLEVPRRLRESIFLLIHRALNETTALPSSLLDWKFLSDLSVTFQKSQSLRELLPVVWKKHQLGETASMRKGKSTFTAIMEHNISESQLEDRVAREMALSKSCYPYAQMLMVGSDILDSIVSAYDRVTLLSSKSHLEALIYVCFNSLMNELEPRTSTLIDHLFSLKSTNIVKALIESTPFLANFKSHISTQKGQSGRATHLLEDFAEFHRRPKPKNRKRKTIAKGKRKVTSANRQDIHIHRLSLVTQLQDLFPDLGSGFLVKLLDEYDDNTEEITAHLLDNKLPPHLHEADHSEIFDFSIFHDLAPTLSPASSPPLPPIRHNIYDGDDFDNLAVDASKLHLGRKNNDLTADEMLSSDRPSHQKAAILSALAAFDSDDDERDDTYDAEDVGGTVDTTFADNKEDTNSHPKDETLFNAYRMTPELFNRDWNTRRGQPRALLKRETGMTDEAIEGWAIMLSRDPKRLKRLENTYEMRNTSYQRPLETSSWRADSGTEVGERENLDGYRGPIGGQAEGRGQGGRGRGRGGRGRGGVTGPANERDTQVARRRKDAHKDSRANHNRRDQRAKKFARGGFPG